MEKVIATISRGPDVLVKYVTVWIKFAEKNGKQVWHGSFFHREGDHVPVGGPYTLTTNDGREGEIMVSRSTVGGRQETKIEFVGSGPFA